MQGLPRGFSVSLNQMQEDSIKLAVLNPVDAAEIWLTLKDKLAYSDTVLLSYEPGNIQSANGLELLPFSNEEVQNTLMKPTSDRVVSSVQQVVISPMPLKSRMHIVSPEAFQSLQIYNTAGMRVYSRIYDAETYTDIIDLSLDQGNYVLRLTGARSLSRPIIIAQ
jgi:hypothetical protein